MWCWEGIISQVSCSIRALNSSLMARCLFLSFKFWPTQIGSSEGGMRCLVASNIPLGFRMLFISLVIIGWVRKSVAPKLGGRSGREVSLKGLNMAGVGADIDGLRDELWGSRLDMKCSASWRCKPSVRAEGVYGMGEVYGTYMGSWTSMTGVEEQTLSVWVIDL